MFIVNVKELGTNLSSKDRNFTYILPRKAAVKVKGLKAREQRFLSHIFDEHLRGYAGALSKIGAVYYGLLMMLHPLVLGPELGVTLAAFAGVTFLVSVGIGFGLRYHHIQYKNARHFMYLLLQLGILNTYFHVFITGDPLQVSLGTMVPVIVGLISFDIRAYLLSNFISLVLFVLSLKIVGGPYVVHFIFMYLLTFLMSVIAYFPRISSFVDQNILLIKNRQMNKSLQIRTAEAEEAAKKAQRMSEIKSEFLANVSHELRTPLTGVAGLIDVIERENKDDNLLPLITHARESAKLLKTLINDILDFSKMEAGKLTLTEAPMVVPDVAKAIVNMMVSAAEAKGLSLVYEQDGDPLCSPVMGDSVRLSQVLFNYVGNAIKFTENGEVVLKVTAEDQGLYYNLTFAVSDTGAGIAFEDQKKLFRRFEQAATDDRDIKEGTGLGLAIAREISQLMDGEVGVDSRPGEGSIFWLKAQLKKTELHKEEVEDYMQYLKDLPALKILFAEDNPVNRMIINKLLVNIDAKVDEVEDGLKALEAAREKINLGDAYDLIITDVRMPVMDGREATEKMRAEGIETPVIFITANTQAEEIDAYKRAGMSGFISKPIDSQVFYKQIYDLVGPVK